MSSFSMHSDHSLLLIKIKLKQSHVNLQKRLDEIGADVAWPNEIHDLKQLENNR